MATAPITGCTGQDGLYFTEFLREKGHEVRSLKRGASSLNTDRLDHIYQDIHEQTFTRLERAFSSATPT
jgi:GDPmannose 4,6-dehydratase